MLYRSNIAPRVSLSEQSAYKSSPQERGLSVAPCPLMCWLTPERGRVRLEVEVHRSRKQSAVRRGQDLELVRSTRSPCLNSKVQLFRAV
jgi:hypothetical protein